MIITHSDNENNDKFCTKSFSKNVLSLLLPYSPEFIFTSLIC